MDALLGLQRRAGRGKAGWSRVMADHIDRGMINGKRSQKRDVLKEQMERH